jgi:ATP-dependent helicase/nuclease subunit A
MTAKIHFVSAGAGSGKTHRLTEILHAQLTSGDVRPSGVIATTFTRKAATELRERARSHLLKQGAYLLAHAMGQARIGTVNSVCGGLLERFAFEAGLATEQQVLEEVQAGVLIGHAIDAVRDGPQVAELLKIVQRLGIDDWQAELKDLVDQVRANGIAPALLSGFAVENAADLLRHFPKPAKEDLSAQLLATIATAMPALVSAADGGKKNTNDYLVLVRDLEREVKTGRAPWSAWVKVAKKWPEVALKSVAEPINVAAARFAEHPGLHADVADYLQRMFDLCSDALRTYANAKREMGVLDFADQEHLLLQVLDEPAVAATLDQELDLLLVDEFQDTSPMQLALFLKLADHAREVYWVGDIKQAIYGFRGSDAALMEGILAALPGLGGDKEILGSSWRSRPPLVRLVNEVFANAFAPLLASEDVVLRAKRSDKLEGPVFGNWILGGKNKGDECSALAGGVRRLVESKQKILDKDATSPRAVRFGDIAILSRSNDGVNAIAAALRAAGIPTATAQPGLLATPEAVLALACLRRLSDPSDTIASAEIFSLADSSEPETWLVDRLQHLANRGDWDSWREGADDPHPILATLARLRTELPLLAPREALQTVIVQCGLASRVLRWKQDVSAGRERLANLDAMLALAVNYEDICRSRQHAASISGLILWLNEQAANALDPLAEPALDAVKVMTNHGAKGLEWPVVVLTDLQAKVKSRLWSITASSRTAIDVGNPLKDRFIRYWPWPFGKQGSVPVADEIDQTDVALRLQTSAVAEAKRLLYVSMTRARDLLILARSQRSPTGEWLETVDAPWLLPTSPADALTLPSGEAIDALHWELDPIDPSEATATVGQPVFWFCDPATPSTKLPLVFNPSAATSPECKVLEAIPLGQRIALAPGTDMAQLGTAIHACVAASFTDPGAPLLLDEVDRTLTEMGLGDRVSAASMLGNIETLHEWIGTRWPSHRAFAEVPVEARLHNGQIMQGRIDLLLELDDGWVLIDHKSNPQRRDQWESVAQAAAGQLSAYKHAVELATGKPVTECWLFLPVSAGAVRVEI